MNIRYVARSISRRDTGGNSFDMFFGSGTVSSFGTGLSTTTHAGTFTNTGKADAIGPIFVVAALTSKLAGSIDRFNEFAKGKKIPVNCFFFIPSVATATWLPTSDDAFVWANLPDFTLKAGKSYKGYYVPLSAMPPFSSRAEVGGIDEDSKMTVHIKDYFLMSAAYFDITDDNYSDRLKFGEKVIEIKGGDADNYTKETYGVGKANIQVNFSQILYAAVDDGTPSMTVRVSGVKSESQDEHKIFKPIIELNTSEVSNHSKIGLSKEHVDISGRHGLDTIGNSGFINNKNIPLDGFLTKREIPTNTRVVHVGVKSKTVAGVDYMNGGYKRVNVYLAK